MCIITLLDTEPNVIDKKDIKLITISNSLLGNYDGFGYYLFNDDKLDKSKEEASNFWREKFSNFNNIVKSLNGIYHVRKASFSNGYNNNLLSDTNITDDKAHPFIYNDIIVAHNGFLNFRYTHVDSEKYEKDIRGDLIDSQKFAIVLSKFCNTGKVTFNNIKDSLNLFSGAYALVVKGKKDNFAWLIRGKDRTLYQMNILNNKKKKMGIFINTTTFSQFLLGEMLLDYGYDYEIKELKENTAYKYKLGNYELEEIGEIKQDSTFISKKSTVAPIIHHYPIETSNTIYDGILDLMYDMNLLMSDMIILSELIFNKPLLILDIEEFNMFKLILEKLKDEAHNSRKLLWKDILKTNGGISVYKMYSSLGIQYPYFMNTKEELKSLLTSLNQKESEDTRNGLPFIS